MTSQVMHAAGLLYNCAPPCFSPANTACGWVAHAIDCSDFPQLFLPRLDNRVTNILLIKLHSLHQNAFTAVQPLEVYTTQTLAAS